MGVMLNRLGGNSETIEAITSVLNKKIINIEFIKNDEIEDHILITTKTGKIKLFDDGQSCCESRYMHTDDNLKDFIGATILKFQLKDGPEIEEDHEVQFLEIDTTKGPITFANHNKHNGYYGGFAIVAKIISPINK